MNYPAIVTNPLLKKHRQTNQQKQEEEEKPSKCFYLEKLTRYRRDILKPREAVLLPAHATSTTIFEQDSKRTEVPTYEGSEQGWPRSCIHRFTCHATRSSSHEV